MKNRSRHRVPLTEPMIALLRRQPTLPRLGMPRTGFVFCNSRAQALGESAMLQRFQKLRPGVTVHGSARSGFSSWSSDVAKVRFEVREASLAHCSDPVVRAYLRTDSLDERRELMTQWSQFCLTPNNVTPLLRDAV
jgi:integrase